MKRNTTPGQKTISLDQSTEEINRRNELYLTSCVDTYHLIINEVKAILSKLPSEYHDYIEANKATRPDSTVNLLFVHPSIQITLLDFMGSFIFEISRNHDRYSELAHETSMQIAKCYHQHTLALNRSMGVDIAFICESEYRNDYRSALKQVEIKDSGYTLLHL